MYVFNDDGLFDTRSCHLSRKKQTERSMPVLQPARVRASTFNSIIADQIALSRVNLFPAAPFAGTQTGSSSLESQLPPNGHTNHTGSGSTRVHTLARHHPGVGEQHRPQPERTKNNIQNGQTTGKHDWKSQNKSRSRSWRSQSRQQQAIMRRPKACTRFP